MKFTGKEDYTEMKKRCGLVFDGRYVQPGYKQWAQSENVKEKYIRTSNEQHDYNTVG